MFKWLETLFGVGGIFDMHETVDLGSQERCLDLVAGNTDGVLSPWAAEIISRYLACEKLNPTRFATEIQAVGKSPYIYEEERFWEVQASSGVAGPDGRTQEELDARFRLWVADATSILFTGAVNYYLEHKRILPSVTFVWLLDLCLCDSCVENCEWDFSLLKFLSDSCFMQEAGQPITELFCDVAEHLWSEMPHDCAEIEDLLWLLLVCQHKANRVKSAKEIAEVIQLAPEDMTWQIKLAQEEAAAMTEASKENRFPKSYLFDGCAPPPSPAAGKLLRSLVVSYHEVCEIWKTELRE